MPKNTQSNLLKKKYIEDRLGTFISVEELVRLKTVFSLEQFLSYNNIDNVNCKPNRALRLNEDYVGFLSVRNEYIIYRDITNTNKLRYDKYTVVPDLENSRKFYSIPNSIDLTTDETIIINMAEGVFDILGVYYHIMNKNDKNNIYVAICDSGYTSVIKYFMAMGLVGENIIINIFSDSDHDPYFYKNMVNELSVWVKEINLYYNAKSKDFGVIKENIELIRRKIK